MQKTREEARRLALKYADEMTAEEDAALTAAALADPDNPPRNAGGRPKSENPKEAVKLRIDADVLARFREGGRGWQTRVNEALRKAVGL